MNSKIKNSANPDSRKNWLITVEINSPVFVSLRMVPDKLVAEHSSIKNHISEIALQNWSNPEEMILAIIEDVNNELVPKWLEVVYKNKGLTIKIEDLQPGLTNFNPPER